MDSVQETRIFYGLVKLKRRAVQFFKRGPGHGQDKVNASGWSRWQEKCEQKCSALHLNLIWGTKRACCSRYITKNTSIIWESDLDFEIRDIR